MRLSLKLLLKLLLLFALLALTSLSCKVVTGPVEDATPTPNDVPDPGSLVFKPETLPDGQVGADYRVRLTVENDSTPVGQFSLKDGQLPPGLTLEKVAGVESTAEISGTPTQAGTYQFTLYVWCYGTQRPGQTGVKEYTIVVK